MSTFKVKQIGPLGPFDQKYGQRYWGSVHDSDMAVSFNLMNPVELEEGMELEFEERLIKETGPQSKNPGTEYMQLRKVKVAGAKALASIPPSDNTKLLELIYADTQKLLTLVDTKSLSENWTKAKKDVVADVPEGPIDMDDIPF